MSAYTDAAARVIGLCRSRAGRDDVARAILDAAAAEPEEFRNLTDALSLGGFGTFALWLALTEPGAPWDVAAALYRVVAATDEDEYRLAVSPSAVTNRILYKRSSRSVRRQVRSCTEGIPDGGEGLELICREAAENVPLPPETRDDGKKLAELLRSGGNGGIVYADESVAAHAAVALGHPMLRIDLPLLLARGIPDETVFEILCRMLRTSSLPLLAGFDGSPAAKSTADYFSRRSDVLFVSGNAN